MQAALRISFPCPLVVAGGSNLPEGQEPVGMFAYRLVSRHRRLQTVLSGIGEEGTVTTAGVVGLNVVTGWEQRRPEWVEVAWLPMRVHVGRQRKGGVDVIDVEGEEDPPPPPPGSGKPSPLPRKGTPMPPPPPKRPRVWPPRRSGRSGREGTGRGGRWGSGWSSSISRSGRERGRSGR